MYAVVTTGGKQYRVEAGSELVIERLAAGDGASFTFDRVLLVGDGEAVTIGTPTVDGATVTGTVLGEELGPKLIIFKFKQKATYRRTRGHRQHLVRVRVDEITAGGKSVTAETAEKATKPTKPKRAASAKAETAEPEEPAKASAAPKAAEKPAKPARKAASAKADETEKPARARKPAAKADATDAPAKPAPRRRSPAKKAESKE
ncbi:MAG: large subunit ribosomal protein [Chloroflexota bacterium]|jgi:large subunit ribosomal protein L21|nr:large subunit ribosomal protein [Chloroflexota bacterium]